MTDKPKRPAPQSVRMKPEVRQLVASRAAGFGLSVNAYMVWRSAYDECPPPRSRGRVPIKDHQALSAVLAKLANSHIAGNLNQLAKAANSGSLILTPEIEGMMCKAAADIELMRDLLIKAFGLSDAS